MRFSTAFGLLLVAALATSALAQNFTTACAADRTCGVSQNIFCTFGACFGTNLCTINKDVAIGGTCSVSSGSTIGCDTRFAYCGGGNTCRAKVTTGTTCNTLGATAADQSAACQTGLCANNVCTAIHMPGETCSSSSQCRVSTAIAGGLTCDSQSNTCTGAAQSAACCLGAACTGGEVGCASPLHCSSTGLGVAGTCQPRIAAGASCTVRGPDPNQCIAGHVCTDTTSTQPTTGTCTKLYSQSSTDQCGSIEGDLICRDDLACTSGGRCATVSNSTACSNDNGCGSDGTCGCTGTAALCRITGSNDCSNNLVSYIDCLAEKNCYAPTDVAFNPTLVFQQNSCMRQCRNEFALYHCCRGTEWRLPAGEFTCPTPTPTPSPVQDQVDGVGLGLGVPLFFIALVVSLLVLCEIPQQRSPYLWLSLCWWHMWDHEIDEFIKEHELSIAKTIKFGFQGQEEVEVEVEEEVVQE